MAVERYLSELERLEAAVSGVRDPSAPVPVHEDPLLQSAAAEPVIAAAARLLAQMAQAVSHAGLPEKLTAESTRLLRNLEEDPGAAVRLVHAALTGESEGIGGFLAWKALSRALPPLELTGWDRGDCPACGALPAMAQLRATERGRERVLVCGRCATRWAFRRIGCPYCENDAADQLGVLEPVQEDGFRIDVCRRCNAYLKTYVGEGDPAAALSDWTTLHLDAACAERGLLRRGPSLYQL